VRDQTIGINAPPTGNLFSTSYIMMKFTNRFQQLNDVCHIHSTVNSVRFVAAHTAACWCEFND